MAKKSPQIGQKVNQKPTIEWKVAEKVDEPWQRMAGEPTRWFAAFEQYRLMGTRRTLEDAWRKDREAAGVVFGPGLHRRSAHFFKIAKQWNWQERAAAWDVAEIQRIRREFAEDAKRDKAERIKLLKSARGKLIMALPSVDVSSIRLDSLINAIRMIVVELRSEYGDNTYQPEDLTEEEVDVAIEEALAELASRKESPISTEPSL